MQEHHLGVPRPSSARVVGVEGAGRDGQGFWINFGDPPAYIGPLLGKTYKDKLLRAP